MGWLDSLFGSGNKVTPEQMAAWGITPADIDTLGSYGVDPRQIAGLGINDDDMADRFGAGAYTRSTNDLYSSLLHSPGVALQRAQNASVANSLSAGINRRLAAFGGSGGGSGVGAVMGGAAGSYGGLLDLNTLNTAYSTAGDQAKSRLAGLMDAYTRGHLQTQALGADALGQTAGARQRAFVDSRLANQQYRIAEAHRPTGLQSLVRAGLGFGASLLAGGGRGEEQSRGTPDWIDAWLNRRPGEIAPLPFPNPPTFHPSWGSGSPTIRPPRPRWN